MSHFNVFVVGEDVEEQLKPYDENAAMEPKVEEIGQSEIKSISEEYKLDPTNLAAIARKAKEWNGGVCRYDKRLGKIFRTYYSNPRAKWDWWTTGGRWRDSLRLKSGEFADVARKSDIDIDFARGKAEAFARVQHAKLTEAIAGLQPLEFRWDELLARKDEFGGIDAVRDKYNAQPVVEAFRGLHNYFGIFDKVEDFLIDVEEHVKKARLNAFLPFAIVIDGQWYERGEMGWFAFVSDEKKPESWASEFWNLWDGIDDDELITVVDCHI